MISRKYFHFILGIIALALAIASCGGSETPEPTTQATEEKVEPVSEAEASVEEESTEIAPSGMRTFVIVPEESKASYLVDEEFFEDALSKLGISAGKKDVIGSTQVIEGQLQINPNDMGQLLGENRFKVDMRTLRTDQERRDNYILDDGPAFNRFPEATFEATEVSGLPTSYSDGEEIQFQMKGILTVHEVPVPITFDVTAILDGDTLTGIAETRALMTDFGIEPPNFARTLAVADEFGIRVELTAKENTPAG